MVMEMSAEITVEAIMAAGIRIKLALAGVYREYTTMPVEYSLCLDVDLS
jgi:hypothetical protein